jgi:hypothetical protein
MKKFTLFMVALFTVFAANAWTVKYTNPNGWSNVGIWAYNGGTKYTGDNWPGTKMTKSGNVWTYTYTGTLTGTPANVIFNNNVAQNGSQSNTFTFVDGATYGTNGIITYAVKGDFFTDGTWVSQSMTEKESGVWVSESITITSSGCEFGVQKLDGGEQTDWYGGASATLPLNTATTIKDSGLTNFQLANGTYVFTVDMNQLTITATSQTDNSGSSDNSGSTTTSAVYDLWGSWQGTWSSLPLTEKDGLWVSESTTVNNCEFGVRKMEGTEQKAWYAAVGTSEPVALTPNTATTITSDSPKNFSLVAGTYVFTLDMANMKITATSEKSSEGGEVVGPDNVYIVGNVNGTGFQPKDGVAMTKDGNIYTLKGAIVNKASDDNNYGYFLFTTALGDWDTVKNSPRFGASSADETIATDGTTAKVVLGSEYSWMVLNGTYDIVFDYENMTLSVTLVESGKDDNGEENKDDNGEDTKVDYTKYTVALGGGFATANNKWDYTKYTGTCDEDGNVTIKEVPVGEYAFNVYVANNGVKVGYYYTANKADLVAETETALVEGDGSMMIASSTASDVYDITYNVQTNTIKAVKVVKEVVAPDYTTWYVNLGGDYNNGDYYNGGVSCTEAGIAVFESVALSDISKDSSSTADLGYFAVKVYNGSDKYYITENYAKLALNTPTKLVERASDAKTQFCIDGGKKGDKYNVTYDVTTNTITVTLVEEGGKEEVSGPEHVYLIGDIDGNAWSTTASPEMVKSSTGNVYSVKATIAVADKAEVGYFSMITALAPDWNTKDDVAGVNDSDRYGAATQNEAVTLGTASKVVKFAANVDASGANSWAVAPGTYSFVFDFDAMTMTVTAEGDDNGEEEVNAPEQVYLMGTFTGWDTSKGVAMTKNGNIYTIDDITLTTDGDYSYFTLVTKLGSNWDEVNEGDRYGAATKDELITMSQDGTATASVVKYPVNVSVSGALSWKFASNNNRYAVTFDYAKMTISLALLSGVESIEADDAEAVYFNLQGVRVNNPEKGIFIRVANGKSSKVVK